MTMMQCVYYQTNHDEAIQKSDTNTKSVEWAGAPCRCLTFSLDLKHVPSSCDSCSNFPLQ